uniref:Oxysterol-binding protein n=1 Tax=Sinocyclocheilus rhinocerous TaxID=307959 RepID=A0A673G0H1_9TELE
MICVCLCSQRQNIYWEIVEGLRGGLSNVQEPEKQAGYMLKKRKWPMKGWHKVCINASTNVLVKIFGIIRLVQRFPDLKATERIHANLPEHIALTLMDSRASLAKQSSLHSPLSFTSQAKVTAWLQSSDDTDRCTKELSVCEAQLLELNHLLRSMEVLHRTCSAPAINALQASTYDSPKKEKRHPRKWRPKNYGKDNKTTLQVPSCISAGSVRLHASNPNLSSVDLTNEKTYHEILESPIDVSKLQEDFCLHTTMKSALCMLTTEKERLKQMLEHESCPAPSAQLLGLKNTLAAVCSQTHSFPLLPTIAISYSSDGSRPLVHQASNESRASITESLSEFFDAQEVLLSASSSENEPSEDDSYISDISDNVSMDNFSNEVENDRLNTGCVENGGSQEQRRSCLPSPSPNTSNISLWTILKNNIGKDLSKVAMPVQLNEPLNTLQRLCEELEYSELLDKAAHTQDPFERMVYIATFAVSGYASSYYRAGGKPFNPVLGETYECDRPDKGFCFVAEQVSHHPPISACHAESKNFIFWQDMRWRNKFWGKSMEIVSVGTTHVVLPGFGDHYEWNKVTSCIHNILSGQRWIEHYGEISIKNSNSEKCQCKVTFIKAKYWNSSMNEVEGGVTDHKGKVVHKLFGKWHEGMYCGSPPSATCIWRMNPMPPDYEQYYGFTKFAMELNETKLISYETVCGCRLLEEGNIESAEVQKQRIEQLQRERRRVLEDNHMSHQPRFFQKSRDDTWVSNNTYWELRKDPGFSNFDCPVLW